MRLVRTYFRLYESDLLLNWTHINWLKVFKLIQQKERSLTALNLGAGQFATDYNFEIAFFALVLYGLCCTGISTGNVTYQYLEIPFAETTD